MLKIGDWVTQYSNGFWKIVDIKPKYAEEDGKNKNINYKKGDLIGSWVLMKKGFTPKMKFKMASDCCDSVWCKPVSDEVLSQIEYYFKENPDDLKTFLETPFKDEPSVCTSWIHLTNGEVELFKKALWELPERFTLQESMVIFEKYGVEKAFGKPPANYIFHCEHTVWDLDENFDPIYKNPELKESN